MFKGGDVVLQGFEGHFLVGNLLAKQLGVVHALGARADLLGLGFSVQDSARAGRQSRSPGFRV